MSGDLLAHRPPTDIKPSANKNITHGLRIKVHHSVCKFNNPKKILPRKKHTFTI